MAKKNSKFETKIIDNIREIRKEKKVSQSHIAFILGVTNGYIGQIESGRWPAMYTLDQLNKIAEDFECNPQDFIPNHWIIEPVKQIEPVKPKDASSKSIHGG